MRLLPVLVCLSIYGFSGTFNYAPFNNRDCPEKKFVIGIASYNNEKYYKKNLNSALFQNYKNYRIIYIDDASTDNTYESVKEYILNLGQKDRVLLFSNETNKGAMYNHFQMVHMCEDDEIYVSLDGDDWFAHQNVLKILNSVYFHKHVWVTYGNEQLYPTGKKGKNRALTRTDLALGRHRSKPFVYAPPRSFYAGLFKKIPEELFCDEEGKFFETSCDVAYMFNLIDMARDHVYFIDRTLYVYNIESQLNDYKLIPEKQLEIESMIRNRVPLKPLHDWRQK